MDVHGPHGRHARPQPARGRVDARAGGRVFGEEDGRGAVLRHLPRQRRHGGSGQAEDPVERGRHCGGTAAAESVEGGLEGQGGQGDQ